MKRARFDYMFCTKCGKPVDENHDFCIHCGNKIDYKIIDEECSEQESKIEEEITNNENVDTPDEEPMKVLIEEHIEEPIKVHIEEPIKESKSEDNEIIENIKNESTKELVNNTQTPLNKQNMKQEIEKLCGGFFVNEAFEKRVIKNGLNRHTTSNFYYKRILKNEIKSGHINTVEELESRLDELMKMDVDTLYSNEDVKKRGTHHFRTQDDLNKFFREKKELAAKNAIEKHEKYLNELRETKTAKISIPYGKGIENSATFGALTGDIIGSGAGAVIGGALGAGDMLDVLGGAATGSLILGGAGAVIGGLINAADDGITWAESVLVIKEEILTISGKFSLNLTDIHLVELSTYKNKDLITLTLNNRSMQFATPDGKALKIVLEECIEEAKTKSNEKQQTENLIQTENNISISVELIKYNDLYKQGIITENEFNALKKKLLNL